MSDAAALYGLPVPQPKPDPPASRCTCKLTPDYRETDPGCPIHGEDVPGRVRVGRVGT